jgi:hypothetical protein
VSKWNRPTVEEWRGQVTREAKKISRRSYDGEIIGPDLTSAIIALVEQASKRYPVRVEDALNAEVG